MSDVDDKWLSKSDGTDDAHWPRIRMPIVRFAHLGRGDARSRSRPTRRIPVANSNDDEHAKVVARGLQHDEPLEPSLSSARLSAGKSKMKGIALPTRLGRP